MELTKKDTQAAKGVAVLAMVMLHLFCRTGELPYTPLVLLLMLALCVAVSYGIRVVYDPLCNRLMKGKV